MVRGVNIGWWEEMERDGEGDEYWLVGGNGERERW